MKSPRPSLLSFRRSRSQRGPFWKSGVCLACGTLSVVASLFTAQTARAASATWLGTTDGNFATGTNWNPAAAPGATGTLTNLDTATFNSLGNSNTTLTIDANRNLGSFLFTTAATSYTIGSAGANGGNSLLLSSTGSIQLAAALTGTNITQTFNAPIVLQPATGTTAGVYTFTNLNTSGSNALVFNGNISAGTTTSTETLTLAGASTSGMNTINGAISNGSATGNTVASGLLAMNVSISSGNWNLTSTTSNYTGLTQLNGGTLGIGASSTGSGATLAGPLGSGALIFNGGTIQAVGGARTIGNQIAFNADNAGTIGGANDLTFTGAMSLKVTVNGKNFQHYVTLTSNNTGLTTFAGGIDMNNQQLKFQGSGRILVNSTISDTAPGAFLQYGGTGSLTLSGTNTYADSTRILQGSLIAATNAPAGAAGAFGNSNTALGLGDGAAFGTTNFTGAASILTNGAYTIGRNITETTGATNITLSIGGIQTSGISAYTGNITLTKNTTLTSAAGGEVDFTTGVISGAFSPTIDGGGLVKLTGANTFSGGSVTIQGGTTLNIANATAGGNLGAANNALVFNNGILQFGTVFDPSTRTMTFNGGGAIFDTAGQTITFANPVGNNGVGGLTLNDSAVTKGFLVLSAANTYSGGTTVTAGTLQTSGAGTLGVTSGGLTVNTGGTLDLNGTSQNVGILNGTGGTVVNNAGGVSTLTVGNGNTTGGSYAGVIANNNNAGAGTVALSKTGSGIVTLTGVNTYTGPTSISAGSLTVGGANGTLGGTAITTSGSGTLQIGIPNSTVNTILGTGAAGSLTINSGGGLSLVNNVFNQLTLNGASGSTGFTLGGGGNLGLDVGASTSDKITLGGGVLTLATGVTTVNLTLLSNLTGGTQQLIAGNFSGTTDFTLGTITNTSLLNGYTLSLLQNNTGLFLVEAQTTGAYWKGTTSASWSALGNFTTDLAGTTARSTPLDASTVVTFIANGGTNFANTTLDGSYTINSLTFNIGGVGINNGAGTNVLTIASGGGITVNGGLGAATETINANVALGASQTWTVTDAASTLQVGGNVTGAFGLSKAGLGTLVLSGTNTYSGQTTVSAGNLNIRSNGALGGTSGVIVNNGAALQLQGGITTTAATSLTLNGTGAGTAGTLENISGANTYSGLISLGSASTIGSDAGSLTLSNTGTITGPGLSLTLTGAGNGSLASAIGTGAGSLIKTGTGAWTLSGANTYTGGTILGGGTLALTGTGTVGGTAGSLTVNAGTLDLGGTSQTVGNFTGTGGAVINNGVGASVLTVGNGNATSGNFAGSLANGTGTLALIKTGTGVQTLSGANMYTGATTISGGALNIANSGGLGNGLSATSGVSVASNSALQLTGGAGSITTMASVPLTLNGTGNTPGSPNGALESVSGTNTFAGPITLGSAAMIGADAGTLTLNSATPIAGGGNDLTFGGAGNVAVSSVINTTVNSVNKNGTGTLTLSGNNTYTGPTNLNAGTLVYTSVNALGSAGMTNAGAINLGSGTNPVNLTYAGPGATLPTQLYFTGTTGQVTLGNIGTGPINYVNNGNFFFGTGGARTIQLGNATDSIGGSIATITDNDFNGAVTTVTKAGLSNSLWNLGLSSYTGTTNVIGGVLQSADLVASSPYINLNGSGTSNYAILQGNGTFTRLLGTGASVNGPTVSVNPNSGFSAQGGKLTVTLSTLVGGVVTPNGQVTYGSGGFQGAGGSTFAFGSTTSDSQIEFTNSINLATTDAFSKIFFVEKGVGGDSALLSGVITNGAGTAAASGITKQGRGTMILSGASTFSGLVTVSGGTLVAGADSTGTTSGAFGTGTGPSILPTAPSAIILGDGNTGSGGNPSVLIGGAFTVGRPLSLTDSGTNNTYSVGGSTDATSNFTGLITATTGNAAATNTFTVTQVATTGANALNLTGGMNVSKAVTFNNVGAVNVTTAGITGAGTVTKANTGILTFTAANTYTGATTVNGGVLLVNGTGSTAATSLVTVNTGGTLGGTGGTIGGATTLTLGGNITGGTLGGVGTLNLTSSLTLNSGSIYQLDIGAAGVSDVLNIGGLLTSNGATIRINSGTLDGTSTYIIANYAAGETAGSNANFVLVNAPNYAVLDTGTVLELVPAPVPEPSTWAACVIGLLAVVGLAKRKRNAA